MLARLPEPSDSVQTRIYWIAARAACGVGMWMASEADPRIRAHPTRNCSATSRTCGSDVN
jgi:hypothetical protein